MQMYVVGGKILHLPVKITYYLFPYIWFIHKFGPAWISKGWASNMPPNYTL